MKTVIILVGYDIESRKAYGYSESCRLFFQKAVPLHKSFSIPCTAFVLGQTLEENAETLREVSNDPFWDIQQHSFSHITFRKFGPAREDSHLKTGVDAEIDVIEDKVSKANDFIKEILGITCRGICAPRGYFNGLRGRRDILQVLDSHGIGFVRSYGRNEKDWQPVPFSIQPFWYAEDGYPRILEIPMQGWQDNIWRRTFGWKNKDGFLRYLKESVDYVAKNGLVWSCCFHDWSSIREDPNLDILKKFLEYALRQEVTFMSHFHFYELMLKEEDGHACTLC